MAKNTWNKKALAALTIASVIGLLSPMAANAWDEDPDTIVTASVDLGDGTDGGGGGNTCTGYGTLEIPSSSITLTKERKILKSYEWTADSYNDDSDDATAPDNDDSNPSSPDPRNLAYDPVNVLTENTRTVFVSEPFTVAFDADNCVDSTKSGAVWTERQPVERLITDGEGDYWSVREMANLSGVLGDGQLRATSNLKVDYSLFGVNRNNYPIFESVPFDNQPQGTNETVYPDQGPPVIWGSSGEANATATLNIFGDQPQGKWRVKYAFYLETGDNINSGPWICFFNGC